MAQLSSPGVSVTVIDESFYTPAAPGTTPLIIVTSEESKQNGAGTGIAPGTLKANAGQVYLLTSQKDLADTFGTPMFKTDANNNPIHGGEQNEYGLQAAYSYLGVSNRAFVVRADIDLGMLDATGTAPTGAPVDGTYWFDVSNTAFGIFEWDSASADTATGQTFINKIPTVITDKTKLVGGVVDGIPLASVGAIGDYAIVATTTLNRLYFKKALTNTAAGTWVEVGSTTWAQAWPAAQGTVATPTVTGTSITINGTTVSGSTTLSGLATDINANSAINTAGIKAAAVNSKLELYTSGTSIVLSGTACTAVGIPAGTYASPSLQISSHTSVPLWKRTDQPLTSNGQATGSVWIKATNPNAGADWAVKKYNASVGAWQSLTAPLYATNAAALAALDSTGGGINLALGQLYVKYNDDEGTGTLPSASAIQSNFKIYARKGAGATTIKSVAIAASTFSAGALSFSISYTQKGTATLSTAYSVSFTAAGTSADADTILTAVTSALPAGSLVTASKIASTNQIVLTHTTGGDIYLSNISGTPLSTLFSTTTTANYYASPTGVTTDFVGTLWSSTVLNSAGSLVGVAPASADAPTTVPADGTLWYNSDVTEVDIMINNGTYWVGYLHYTQNGGGGDATDPAGPLVSATKPTKQSDGTPLANGDLWIDTSDLEKFPRLYKFNYATKKWVLVDTSDQSTENGVLFADARWDTTGTSATPGAIVDLLSNDFVDADAPSPALYPKGMLLWNLRRSGFNVKRYVQGYVDTTARNLRYNGSNGSAGTIGSGQLMTSYYANRWVSEAANQENGAGTFGRKAQRKVVIQKLQALVNANQQIRDEEARIFNLIACPGYPELVGEMVSLNYDRGLTAFVVADTPARLTPDATSLLNWGTNQKGALEDNDDGLVSSDEYLGFFYPWGYTSDNIGNNVVVPPSHMMLRTIALSDNVSYPWFAPAGTRRGGITNATAVGYITSGGEFQSVALNNGQRDTLASIKVNPLTFITGTGLVNYGQYTRAKNASSLDRINVARLVIYLRRQFAQLAKPYVFEPNDKITRDEIKQSAEALLLELVGQRALYDYLVVCDTSNNTPSRIDRNELYLDVAIEPVKAVEFIYIPLRLKNTGEIKGLA
jgi:hypothetical protein